MGLCPAELQLEERGLPWQILLNAGEPDTNPHKSRDSAWAVSQVLWKSINIGHQVDKYSTQSAELGGTWTKRATPASQFSSDIPCRHPLPSLHRAGTAACTTACTAASCPHPEASYSPTQRSPAHIQHRQDLHIQRHVALVTSAPSCPIRAGSGELRPLSLNESNPVAGKSP